MNSRQMALEVAEYHYLSMSTRELIDSYTYQWQDDDPLDVALRKARFTLEREWTQKDPEEILAAYEQLTREVVQ